MTAAAPSPTANPNPVAAMRQRLQRAYGEVHFDSERWLQQAGNEPAQVQRLALAMAPQQALPEGETRMALIRRLTQDPVYQLK